MSNMSSLMSYFFSFIYMGFRVLLYPMGPPSTTAIPLALFGGSRHIELHRNSIRSTPILRIGNQVPTFDVFWPKHLHEVRSTSVYVTDVIIHLHLHYIFSWKGCSLANSYRG